MGVAYVEELYPLNWLMNLKLLVKCRSPAICKCLVLLLQLTQYKFKFSDFKLVDWLNLPKRQEIYQALQFQLRVSRRFFLNLSKFGWQNIKT